MEERTLCWFCKKTTAAAAVLQADPGVYDPEKGFVLSVYYRNEITI